MSNPEPHFVEEGFGFHTSSNPTAFQTLHKLQELEKNLRSKGDLFIGYPCNRQFDLDLFFSWWKDSYLSKIPLNDVGNPDDDSSYGLNTRPFERELIQLFSKLYNLKDPSWGYTTTGGTLGNEQGLYLGRTYLEAYGDPILYVSQEAHYSIRSLAKVLKIPLCIVDSKPSGEMCYSSLKKHLNPSRPALFSISLGTTFKGAIDDIEKIQKVVKSKKVKHTFYHADAALFGGHLAFLKDSKAPKIDFEKHPYCSIAVSGHKFFGSPIPLGFFLTKKAFLTTLKDDYIEYISSSNVTIPCSRSALSTLILWWVLKNKAQDFPKEAETLLENADFLHRKLLAMGLNSYLNPYSNTVYFTLPSPQLVRRWFLATDTCPHLGPLAHAVVMQHVDKKMLNLFIQEMDQDFKRKP